MDQHRPIVKGLDLDPFRKLPGVQLLHLAFDPFKHRQCLVAALKQNDPLNDIIPVVDAYLAQPYPMADAHFAQASDEDRCSVLLGHHDVLDIIQIVNQSQPADIKVLSTDGEIVASYVGITVDQGTHDLGEAHPIADQGPGVEVHVILFGHPPEGRDINNSRHPLELSLKHPVLNRFQVGQRGVVPNQLIAIYLGDGPPGRENRLNTSWK